MFNWMFVIICFISISTVVLSDVKSYKQIVYEAIQRDPADFRFASRDLQNDRGFVLNVLKINWKVIYYASHGIKTDKQFILKAIRLNPKVIKALPKYLINDKKFVIKMVRSNPNCYLYLPEKLQRDIKIRQARSEKNGVSYLKMKK